MSWVIAVQIPASSVAQHLVVLAQTDVATQSSKNPFHDPPTGQGLEPDREERRLHSRRYLDPAAWAPHHRHTWGEGRRRPDDKASGVAAIGQHLSDVRESVSDPVWHRRRPVPFVDIGRMDDYPQQQTTEIKQDVALATAQRLSLVVAAWPPFAVVRTDSLSRIAAVGWVVGPAVTNPLTPCVYGSVPGYHRAAIGGHSEDCLPRRVLVGHGPPSDAPA